MSSDYHTAESLSPEEGNIHWRTVANYSKDVEPLLHELGSADWETALAWHAARWHKEHHKFLRSAFKKGLGKWQEMYRTRPKPVLPIPIPAERDQLLRSETRDFFREVRINMHKRELAAAPNKRKYLADQLSFISRQLGGYNMQGTKQQTQTGDAPKWEFNHDLQQALEYNKAYLRPNQLSWPSPDALGQIQANVDSFWYCYHQSL